MANEKNSSVQHILNILNVDHTIFDCNEVEIQDRLKHKIRQIAVDNLRNGTGYVAKAFRGEYYGWAAVTGKTIDDYLNKQSRDGTWFDDIMMRSAAEALGVHLNVTNFMGNRLDKKTGKMEPWQTCLHRAEKDDALSLKIININNKHFYVNDNTCKDGNCGAGAFSQGLQIEVNKVYRPAAFQRHNAVHQHQNAQQPSKDKIGFFSSGAAHGYEVLAKEQEIERSQAKIEQAIQKHPKPSEMEVLHEQEAKRIAALPLEEQIQIQNDRLCSLQIALEDAKKTAKSSFIPVLRK